MNIEKHQIRITCPECGRVFEETIENIKREMKAFCYSCGAFIDIDEGDLRRLIDEVAGN